MGVQYLVLLLQGYDPYPSRGGLLFALLGIVLGPVMVWQAWQSMRSREGDFDSQLYPAMQVTGVIALIAGLAITAGAAWWLYKWLPEYLMW